MARYVRPDAIDFAEYGFPSNTDPNQYWLDTENKQIIPNTAMSAHEDTNADLFTDENSTLLTDVKTNYTSDTISERMKDLRATINKLNIKFNQNKPIYTQYLKFEVNNNILVDTTSKDWITNNLVNFTIEQNGSGQANQFTMRILLPPNDRSVQDALTIEKILLNTTHIVKEDSNGNLDYNTLKDKASLFMDCKFVYGYGDDLELRSPTYTGKVMKYTPTIENGNLIYEISGYAGLYGTKEIKLSPKQEYLEGIDTDNGTKSPFKYIKNIFDVEFGNVDSEYYNAYKLVFLDGCFENDKAPVYDGEDFTQYNQKNLFNIIDDILKGCLSPKEYDDKKAGKKFMFTQKQCYGYYVNSSTNSDTMGIVYIYKLPSVSNTATDEEKQEAMIPHCNIEFGWFAPTKTGINYLVKSWKPEFDGTIAIAGALAFLTKGDEFEVMDTDGNIRKTNGMGATRLGINADTDIVYNSIQEYSQWSLITQYPHKAKLTMQGCPCEVPLTGRIGVHAKMGNYNQEHFSSGTYFVMSKKDTMNSSGYITEFDLFKVVSTYNPELMDAVKNDPILNTNNVPDPTEDSNAAADSSQNQDQTSKLDEMMADKVVASWETQEIFMYYKDELVVMDDNGKRMNNIMNMKLSDMSMHEIQEYVDNITYADFYIHIKNQYGMIIDTMSYKTLLTSEYASTYDSYNLNKPVTDENKMTIDFTKAFFTAKLLNIFAKRNPAPLENQMDANEWEYFGTLDDEYIKRLYAMLKIAWVN